MQIFTTFPGTRPPEFAPAVFCPPGPYLIKCGNMVRRIRKPSSKRIRRKCYQLMFQINQRGNTLHTNFLHRTIQYILSLGKIINSRWITPTIRSKNKWCYIIKFPIGRRSLSITRAVRLTAPCKITFQRSLLMLHIFLAPSPQTIKNIFSIKLNGNHQSIRHSLCTYIMIFYVADISHWIPHFKIDLIRSIKNTFEYRFQLFINVLLLIAQFRKEITIASRCKSTFGIGQPLFA